MDRCHQSRLLWYLLLFSRYQSIYLHLRIDMLKEANLLLLMILFNVAVQIFIADFVALLVLAVLWQLFLHCVVGEMYASIIESK